LTDLRHHGEADLAPGLVDLAVDVRGGTPPPWLRALLHAALDPVPDGARVRAALRDRGLVMHRGDTVSGLSPDRLRVAVRGPATSVALAADLAAILEPGTPAFRDLSRLPEEIR
jgi:hypothetical protein